MGKVFTKTEFEMGNIPRHEAFGAVGAIVRQEMLSSPAVTAGLIYGSFLRGDYSVRSDIDVVVLYPYEQHGAVVALQQHLQSVAQTRFIPIRIIAVDVDLVRHGDHMFFPMYHEHLRMAAASGGVVKDDPNNFIQPKAMTYRVEAQGYLTQKSNGFDRVTELFPLATEERVAVALSKALSFSVHTARKMLQCLAPDWLGADDSKAAVTVLYPRLGIAGGGDLFFELLQFDHMYTKGLVEQMARSDVILYGALLERLKPALPLARQFARVNLLALR